MKPAWLHEITQTEIDSSNDVQSVCVMHSQEFWCALCILFRSGDCKSHEIKIDTTRICSVKSANHKKWWQSGLNFRENAGGPLLRTNLRYRQHTCGPTYCGALYKRAVEVVPPAAAAPPPLPPTPLPSVFRRLIFCFFSMVACGKWWPDVWPRQECVVREREDSGQVREKSKTGLILVSLVCHSNQTSAESILKYWESWFI